MAIKPIDAIPDVYGGNKTANNRLRLMADIQEAIDNGIMRFEFVGDYNYKNLRAVAQDAANQIMDRELRKAWTAENDTKNEREIYMRRPHYYDRHIHPWILVSSIKGDEKQERRVFCEILPNGLENAMKAHREFVERTKEIKAERERKKVADNG